MWWWEAGEAEVSIMGNVLKAMKDIKSGVTSIIVCKVVDMKPRKMQLMVPSAQSYSPCCKEYVR